MELWEHSATHLAHLIRSKEASATEMARSFCGRIQSTEPLLNAFVYQDEEDWLSGAKAVDRRLAAGKEAGPLAGLPVGLKDNICVQGVPATCASRMLERFVPPYNATVVRRLRSAGALLAGKLNMDEFAMGSSCESSRFGPAKNPWDTGHVPGGSSGGSAAAVAAGQLPFALGSDTGGSVRQPAAFCGLVGLRPTYGAVSRFGLVAFASSLDQIGPLARTADDTALLFAAIGGRDAADATSCDCRFEGPLSAQPSVKGLKIGLPVEYFDKNLQPEVKLAVDASTGLLESLGAATVPVSLPSTRHALAAYYILSSAEASSNLARYDGLRYGFSAEGADLARQYEETRSRGFGPEVQRRILLGAFVLSHGHYDEYYQRAKAMQHRIKVEFEAALEACDVIAAPTAPTTAFRLGEKRGSPVDMYATDRYVVPASMAGLPAVSFPCGLDAAGLPIGMQLMGSPFREKQLLEVVKCYEMAVGGFPRPEVTA